MPSVQNDYLLAIKEIEEIHRLVQTEASLRDDIKKNEKEVRGHITHLAMSLQEVFQEIQNKHETDPRYTGRWKQGRDFDHEQKGIQECISLILSNLQYWRDGGTQLHAYLQNITIACKPLIRDWMVLLASKVHDDDNQMRELRGKGAMIIKAIRFIADKDY